MITKIGSYEFGDVTFIVDDKDRKDELTVMLSGELDRTLVLPSFREKVCMDLFMTGEAPDIAGPMWMIYYPEEGVRPQNAKDFVMRVGYLATKGQRIAVLTRDYLILSYAAIIDEYKGRFWPDANAEWRFVYTDANTGEAVVGCYDIDGTPMFISDTVIGREYDRVYDFEAALIYGD